MSELRDALNILDDDEAYQAKIAELTSKINEYKIFIEKKGGFSAITKLETEAQKNASAARKTLQMVKDEAEVILSEAKGKAKEIENTANERSVRIIYLADQKLKIANNKESELKKLKVDLDKEDTRLMNKEKSLEKSTFLLKKRETEVIRKEAILAQL